MSEENITSTLSTKVQEIAKSPKYRGAIFQIEADEKGLALVDVKEASLKIYLMIDPDSDTILETRFFTYGGPIFTALADTFCKKIQQKKISEACSITAISIEEELRDIPEVRAIPESAPEITQMQTLIKKIEETYPEKKGLLLLSVKKWSALNTAHKRQKGVQKLTPNGTLSQKFKKLRKLKIGYTKV